MKEIWKDIKGYEGLYQVSNLGRVKSLDKIVKSANQYGAIFTRKKKGKILKPFSTMSGYLQVTLYDEERKNFLIHRLVAKNFIANTKKLPEVNHIDGNKNNNMFTNLEWVTKLENQQHAIKTGLRHIKTIYQYDLKNGIINIWNNQYEASRETKIDQGSINRCCNKKQKTAGGYIWRYKEE